MSNLTQVGALLASLPTPRGLLPDEEAIDEARAIIGGYIVGREMAGERQVQLRNALDLLCGREVD